MSRRRESSSADKRVSEAEAIIAALRSVPPQYATSDTVDAYRQALALLGDAEGSSLWLEAQAALGSHLLETPDGGRAANIESAESAYRRMLEFASPESAPDAWVAAVSGLANALVTHPSAGQPDFDEALRLNDMLVDTLRQAGAIEPLAIVLGRSAAVYAGMPYGDLDAHLERAIGLQDEAVRLLAKGGDAFAATRGRARHNLAALYAKRRTGMRSQNVDRAIRLLEAALEDRPAEVDPIGRARTLRALSGLYPEWSSPDSLDDAQGLAESARRESEWIEQTDDRAAPRLSGRAYFERQQSALNVDLDDLYTLDPGDRLPWLSSLIENHLSAIEVLSQEAMPLRSAEWMGGLARLLGRLPSLGVWDRLAEAYEAFGEALSAFDPEQHPLLGRQLLERWGELCHEIGDFEGSLKSYSYAADLSDLLFNSIADPEHRSAEIFETRGFALFAAYAAARLDRPEEALVLAERQRMRLHADLLRAKQSLAAAGEERHETIRQAISQIRALEAALLDLEDRDPEAKQEGMQARLADYLGVDPSLLQMRRIDSEADELNPIVEERRQLDTQLGQAREALRHALAEATSAGSSDPEVAASAEEIVRLAEASGCALVYLVATTHGGAAIGALPDGSCDALLLEELTSDLTRGLLYGTEEQPGFAEVALLGEGGVDDLIQCLDAVAEALGPAAMAPMTAWLLDHGAERATLIPLGSLGLLPLHIAAGDSVIYSYAPSSRSLVQEAGIPSATAQTMVVFANPLRDDDEPLPFALAEGRNLMSLVPAGGGAQMFLGAEVTADRVRALAPSSSYVHFGCHGEFRASEPLASHLLLAGDDILALSEVFTGRVDLSKTNLVTLMACRSGNVEFRKTPDESLGFPSALLLAGVRAVVSTMWEVDDAAAALFSGRLFELLIRDESSPAEAVARARSWLRDIPAEEAQNRIASLRAQLDPDDEAQAALSELWRYLESGVESKPFESAEYWGAFIFTGLA